MAKYKNKYRTTSTRLQHWDYSWAGAYFITICTKNRECYFGDIKNDKLQFSPIGAIADVLWHEIKNHSTNVELGEFVVMPNHVHGILILHDAVEERHAFPLPHQPPPPQQPPPNIIDRQSESSEPFEKTIGQKRFQNQGKNTISSIVGGYKSAVTRHVRRLGFEFAWQSLFWDHIIRSDDSYDRITNYIRNNPKMWVSDKLNGNIDDIVTPTQP